MRQVGLPFYLSLKEMWRNRGRFLLVSLVIALITLLVLFIAALGEGLGNGNREYLSRLDAQLIVYQDHSDFLIGASRLSRDRVPAVRRVPGVADAGPLGTSNARLVLPGAAAPLKVAMLGVEPGHTGEPPVTAGRQLGSNSADEVILDMVTHDLRMVQHVDRVLQMRDGRLVREINTRPEDPGPGRRRARPGPPHRARGASQPRWPGRPGRGGRRRLALR